MSARKSKKNGLFAYKTAGPYKTKIIAHLKSNISFWNTDKFSAIIKGLVNL